MRVIVSSLEDKKFLRSEAADVAAGLARLGVAEDSQIGSFYLRYEGPLSSENTGFLLLDVLGARPQESIEAATAVVRSKYGWPARYVVLTSFLGGGVMVYDGDPGVGILLVPVGAVLLLAAVLTLNVQLTKRRG